VKIIENIKKKPVGMSSVNNVRTIGLKFFRTVIIIAVRLRVS